MKSKAYKAKENMIMKKTTSDLYVLGIKDYTDKEIFEIIRGREFDHFQRDVLFYRFVKSGYRVATFKEIAEIKGISQNRAVQIYHHGLRKIKSVLNKNEKFLQMTDKSGSIETLNLSNRILFSLQRHGINTISEAITLIENNYDVLPLVVRNFGKKSREELINKLAVKGFSVNYLKEPDKLSIFKRVEILEKRLELIEKHLGLNNE